MSSMEQELTTLYHEWMEAVRQKDMPTLERIVGQEFVYTASGQGRFSRQQWLEAVTIYNIESFHYDDIDLRDYGEVAVAVVRYQQTAIFAGGPRSGDFLITDVWVRRDGRWQVVARSSILTPPQR